MRTLMMGGNRFFGLHLAKRLLNEGNEVTLLNRGQLDDGLGNRVKRLKADRKVDTDLNNEIAESKG